MSTVEQLIGREISILRIVQDNMGIIQLNPTDHKWIEQLSRASLINEKNYFFQLNSSLDFNCLYVQSYLIRSYLLFCPINYEHVRSQYQCYIRRKLPTISDDVNHVDEAFKEQWNHLEQMNLHQLENEHYFLQRIIDVLTNSIEDLSSKSLSEFVRTPDYEHRFLQQFQQYGIKDFPLVHIHKISRFYNKAIQNFQNLFLDVSQLLRVPIEQNLNDRLDVILQKEFIPNENNKDQLQTNIRLITEFLNDLKHIEIHLVTQSSQPLKQICSVLEIQNRIVDSLVNEINCENYVPLCLKLIEIRSKLQEQTINIEEQVIHLWNPHLDIQDSDGTNPNSFELFRQTNFNTSIINFQSTTAISTEESTTTSNSQCNIIDLLDDMPFDHVFPSAILKQTTSTVEDQELIETNILTTEQQGKIDMKHIAILTISSVSLPSSILFDQSRLKAEQILSTLVLKQFSMKFLDDKQEKYICKPEKLYGQFKKIIQEKKYDSKLVAVIDPHQIFVHFLIDIPNASLPIMFAEYRIINRTSLISIVLHYENNQFEYFAIEQANLSAIIARFIIDNQLKFKESQYYLNIFDELGRHLSDDNQIKDIYRSNSQTSIHIQIIRPDQNTSTACQLTLKINQSRSR